MKKLDEIPKKNIFEVPEGYFDRLPLRIQARVEATKERRELPTWNVVLRYALPIVLVGFFVVYFFRPKPHQTEDLLASISTESLTIFLTESDINEGDLLEIVDLNGVDADSLDQQLNHNLLGDFDVLDSNGVLENEL